MFRKIRLAPITSHPVKGYPEYGLFSKLQEEDFNAVELSISPVVKEKTLSADDTEKIFTRVSRYTGTLKVYEVDQDAAESLFGYRKDAKGNVIQIENSPSKKRFGMFLQSETAEGKKYQKYFYNCVFGAPAFTATTDSGDGSGTAAMEIPITIEFIVNTAGEEIVGATVYEGNDGFVAEGAEPTSMYLEGIE